MTHGFWEHADTVSGVLVNVSVLVAAIAAVVKFRLLNMLSRRYRSELACRHHVLDTGRIVFEADYTVHNTGERPIDVSAVTLFLCPAKADGVLLTPDRERRRAERTFGAKDADKRGLFRVEAGERSIFTLRCEMADLDPVVFVLCQIAWPYRRTPAPFAGMYVRSRPAAEACSPQQQRQN